MKALILDTENNIASVQDITIPSPGPNELLIAVKAVVLNPSGHIHTSCSEFAGQVVARGPPIPQPGAPGNNDIFGNGGGGGGSRVRRSSTALPASISRGDRVAGFILPRGAIAEYIVCPADLVWRVPGPVALEEAVGVSACGMAAAQGLFCRLGLDAPFQWDDGSDEAVLRTMESQGESEGGSMLGGRGGAGGDGFSFFVFGAHTSVGMYVAQLVRRSAEASGRPVRLLGAASPGVWDVLRAAPFAYDHLVDHRDTAWPEQVRQLSSGGVHFAYDAVSEGSTVRDVSTTLRDGGRMAIVRSRETGAWECEGVRGEPVYGAVWESLGEDIEDDGLVVRSSPAKRSFALGFYKWLSDGGMLQPNPVRLIPGGLDRIAADGLTGHDGMEKHMRPTSGEKIVYRIDAEGGGSSGNGHIA